MCVSRILPTINTTNDKSAATETDQKKKTTFQQQKLIKQEGIKAMKRTLLSMVLVAAATMLAGCSNKNDPITKAEKKDADKPSIAEIKAIAEEGFIYGLPIVMNYAVMYEYCVDKDSGQYKGPFNQIANEARVFTYKDTSIITPNSDTPYSMLWLDLRAEPFVLSVPAVEKGAVLLGDALRREHVQLWLHRQPCNGQ